MSSHFLNNLLLFILIVHSSKGQESKPGECPTILPVNDFDEQRFIGRWYEQRRTPRDREDNLVCISFIFLPYFDDNKKIRIDRIALNANDLSLDYATHSGDIMRPGEAVAADGFHYLIPYTDYENVAVFYACKQDENSFKDVVWIVTKNPYPEDLSDAFDAVESVGLYINNWIISDQRRCSYALS